ncbi:GntR family transcriptional regulator [Pseudooceanicola spongiae]|jgi:DNA-binding GntR family transcriptional regulator|uniref:GntR family transcriptional regulator n=1 Tax=Pseudooceanicola spongiae TaxID=2613965 RepID=A0A7L9WLV9_9RHOB|nr:GntR family transcriptional regulator [Pseudooceanicola spongiae]QOL81371.1 GntR family transcriptional regulator [Pseudooceanicola spongiae]|tara:strand:+ start:385 stop:1095 length:711 start_codon:yes stop_codon:yes gene_type:complete
MKLSPLGEATRRDQIVRSLRDLIVSGAVPAGERLTETDLSSQMGVSRAPLREAIRELVSSGLLVSQPYRGLFVREFSPRDLEELYSLRTTLEAMAFRHCWDLRDDAALADLDRRHCDLVRTVERGDDPARAIELELALHSWAYELSGHRLLNEAWQRIHPNLQFYFTLHQRAHSRPGPRRDAHEVYVARARGQDLRAMLDHLEDHMRQGLLHTAQLLTHDADPGIRPGTGTTTDIR